MAKHPIARLYDSWSSTPVPCLWCGEPTGEPGERLMGHRTVRGWWDTSTYCCNAHKQAMYRARKREGA